MITYPLYTTINNRMKESDTHDELLMSLANYVHWLREWERKPALATGLSALRYLRRIRALGYTRIKELQVEIAETLEEKRARVAKQKQIKDQRARERKELRQNSNSKGTSPSEILEKIKGETIYLTKCTPEVRSVALAHRMVSSAMHSAHVFVLPHAPMRNVGQRMMLASRAQGACHAP